MRLPRGHSSSACPLDNTTGKQTGYGFNKRPNAVGVGVFSRRTWTMGKHKRRDIDSKGVGYFRESWAFTLFSWCAPALFNEIFRIR